MQREQAGFSRRQLISGFGVVTLVAAGKAAARASHPRRRHLAAPPAGAFAAAATDIRTELKMLAPNVYAFLQREAPGQSNFSVSNFGIVVGPRSLLAIDAGGGPQHARNFIAAASRWASPFDRVVITHEHPDHIVGLTQFPAGIEIVAQEETRTRMVKMGSPRHPHTGRPILPGGGRMTSTA